jgi:long-chain-fatty-acid--CoA ligase ACSBG
MAKILKIKSNLPHLKAVVQIHPDLEEGLKSSDGFYSFSELEKMDIGDEIDLEYEKRLNDIAANECCCIIYTSGTVGNPKGVMLSHDNVLFSSQCALRKMGNIEEGQEVIVSYLPLSHAAAQILDVFGSILIAGTIYFADKNAMKGTLMKTIVEAKPTIFFTVPRLFEKIHEKMLEIGSQSGFLKKTLGDWAKRVTLQYHVDCLSGKSPSSFQYRLASHLVLSRVKEALGFQRCRTFFSAAAPISEEIKRYFLSLDMFIVEGYGMSESSVHTVTTRDTLSFSTVGKCLPGTLTKIHNADENGHGEICMKGRNIFMGYINEMNKTLETIDDERWLHSGDIGYLDEDGFLYITGRIKELLITSGGENIPYLLIEATVKNECSAVSNALLVGDRKKFLTILLTLKTEMNEDGSPSDNLAPDTIKWLESHDLCFEKLSQVLSNEQVQKLIQEAINRANAKSVSNAQKVQKFALLPNDFSIATGELTPTMKLKRSFVVEKYKEIVEKFYS